MHALRISLLGRFRAEHDGQDVHGLDTRKVQELFCYILLNRNRSLLREQLAAMLWRSDSDTRARSYLRKALWKLQSGLACVAGKGPEGLFEVNAECIKFVSTSDVWLDIDALETAYVSAKNIAAKDLDAERLLALQGVEGLYQGDLLEDLDEDWCISERERYHYMYLAVMHKLLDHYESCGDYDRGIDCGLRILHFDRVHELTYQKLMRLHYFAGDRTSALREYEQCAAALIDILGVSPGQQTKQLYQQILDDAVDDSGVNQLPVVAIRARLDLASTLVRLHEIQDAIMDLQAKVRDEIKMLEGIHVGNHH